jgi:hypothetical protein
MKKCTYCGKEYPDEAEVCAIDQEPLEYATALPSANSENVSTKRFFYWRPASIILIILTVIYMADMLLNLWLGNVFSQRGDQQMSRVIYWGAFENLVVAILCFTSRRMMSRQTRVYFTAGACVLVVAFLIVVLNWLSALLHGRNPYAITEAILILLPMLYAIIYAFMESKRAQTT